MIKKKIRQIQVPTMERLHHLAYLSAILPLHMELKQLFHDNGAKKTKIYLHKLPDYTFSFQGSSIKNI